MSSDKNNEFLAGLLKALLDFGFTLEEAIACVARYAHVRPPMPIRELLSAQKEELTSIIEDEPSSLASEDEGGQSDETLERESCSMICARKCGEFWISVSKICWVAGSDDGVQL
jgi:hypothetical protein